MGQACCVPDGTQPEPASTPPTSKVNRQPWQKPPPRARRYPNSVLQLYPDGMWHCPNRLVATLLCCYLGASAHGDDAAATNHASIMRRRVSTSLLLSTAKVSEPTSPGDPDAASEAALAAALAWQAAAAEPVVTHLDSAALLPTVIRLLIEDVKAKPCKACFPKGWSHFAAHRNRAVAIADRAEKHIAQSLLAMATGVDPVSGRHPAGQSQSVSLIDAMGTKRTRTRSNSGRRKLEQTTPIARVVGEHASSQADCVAGPIVRGHEHCLCAAISLGADPNGENRRLADSPIALAAGLGNYDIVDALVAFGADPTAQGSRAPRVLPSPTARGDAFFHPKASVPVAKAAELRFDSVVRLLLAAGAPPDADSPPYPIVLAAVANDRVSVRHLQTAGLAHGDDLIRKRHVLCLAAKFGLIHIATLCVEKYSADANAPSDIGAHPLDYLRGDASDTPGHSAVRELLVAHGATESEGAEQRREESNATMRKRQSIKDRRTSAVAAHVASTCSPRVEAAAAQHLKGSKRKVAGSGKPAPSSFPSSAIASPAKTPQPSSPNNTVSAVPPSARVSLGIPTPNASSPATASLAFPTIETRPDSPTIEMGTGSTSNSHTPANMSLNTTVRLTSLSHVAPIAVPASFRRGSSTESPLKPLNPADVDMPSGSLQTTNPSRSPVAFSTGTRFTDPTLDGGDLTSSRSARKSKKTSFNFMPTPELGHTPSRASPEAPPLDLSYYSPKGSGSSPAVAMPRMPPSDAPIEKIG